MKIGLTGGIGSGKSTVCALFAGHGVPIIDADIIARLVVEPGQPALDEIVAHFGPAVLQTDGHLDRGEMRKRVFDNTDDKKRLEDILHPRIRALMSDESRRALEQSSYCILAIPLLLETGQQALVDRILVIDCDPEQQLRRVSARDQRSLAETRRIIQSQASREARLAIADEIINNDGDEDALVSQVSVLHARYLGLAVR